HLWQWAAALWPLDDRGRVVAAVSLGIEETIELANRRQPPRCRGGGKAALCERAQIGAHVLGRGLGDAASTRMQMRREVGEVAAIGGKRVGAGAALGHEHVEKGLDQPLVGMSGRAGHTGADGQRCLENLSGGIEIVISRGLGSYQVASANMAPKVTPPSTPTTARNRNRLGMVTPHV